MDARRNQVYTALYRFSEDFTVIKPQMALDIHKLIEELNLQGERVIFLGDGVPVYREMIENKLKADCSFAPPQANRQRGASVAALGMVYLTEGRTETAAEHRPDYLRKAQAERELEEARRQGKLCELAAGYSVESRAGDARAAAPVPGERS